MGVPGAEWNMRLTSIAASAYDLKVHGDRVSGMRSVLKMKQQFGR
jgi:hypothetical protein